MVRKKKKKTLLLGILVVSTAVLLAVLAVRSLRSPRVLARRWQSQLATMPSDKVDAHLHKIAALGDVGIVVLVDALSSKRESVARGAQEVLVEQMHLWRLMQLRQSTSKVKLLARHLAQQTDRLSPSGKSFAADTAMQILLWPTDTATGNHSQLISDCETVLRASASVDGETVTFEQPRESLKDSFAYEQQNTRDGQGHVESALFLDPVGDLPGGALPLEVVQLQTLPPALVDPPADGSPRRLTSRQDASPLNDSPLGDEPPLTGNFPPDSPSTDPPNRFEVRPFNSFTKRPDPYDSPEMKRLLDLDSLETIRRLQSDDKYEKEDAKEELSKRGFRAVHFVLASRLTDPDPDKRRDLARMLPRVSNINPRRWLLWLSLDSDPQVRLEAITVMATSSDPQLLDYIRQLPARETDPEVLRQVDRLLKLEKR